MGKVRDGSPDRVSGEPKRVNDNAREVYSLRLQLGDSGTRLREANSTNSRTALIHESRTNIAPSMTFGGGR